MMLFLAKILFTITFAAIPVGIAAYGIAGYFRERGSAGVASLVVAAVSIPYAGFALLLGDWMWRFS